MLVLYFIISLTASVAGAICGIGGGVIIKPTLDLFHLDTVASVSFLSGCTVLAMSSYSVGRSIIAKDSAVDLKLTTLLGIGAALGGIAGKELFSMVSLRLAEAAGSVQAICLGVITLGTLVYTLCKSHIPTHKTRQPWLCILIGLMLGVMSSFLGIGGGPINLIVLHYFFSMNTKTAAQNSLYIILISQFTSLGAIIFTGSTPEFSWLKLGLMVAGGIGGGMLGRKLNKHIDNKAVDRLFICLMVIIIGISVYNAYQYSLSV